MTLDFGRSERWCLVTESRIRGWGWERGGVDNGTFEERECKVKGDSV